MGAKYYYVYGDDLIGKNVLIYRFWKGIFEASEVHQAVQDLEMAGEFTNIEIKEVEE